MIIENFMKYKDICFFNIAWVKNISSKMESGNTGMFVKKTVYNVNKIYCCEI